MSRHSHDDLIRALARGELAPVYYLHGPEEILKDEAVRTIVERALQPGERDFNLDQRSAQNLAPEDLHALVNTLPMMAARRVVVIQGIEAWKKKTAPREVLQKYLQNPAPETVLVLVEAAPAEEKARDWEPDESLVSGAWAVNFETLPPDRVIRWLTFHARRLEIVFGEGAAEHLATATGYDLGALRSELEKFASLTGQGPISLEQVGDLVGIRHGETLEDWVQAVLGDDPIRAIAVGEKVEGQAGMSGVKMVTALGTALIGVRLARAHYDKGSRGGALERVLFDRLRQVRPFGIGEWKATVKNWTRWAETWPATRLRPAISATLQADQALKGTRISDEAAVIADLTLRLTTGRDGEMAGAARPAAPHRIGE